MSVKFYFYSFILVFSIKLGLSVFFTFYSPDFFGGGNDSNYYDDYAVGLTDRATTVWPQILRLFNDVGLYSRDGVSHVLKFLGFIVIPLLVAKLTYVKGSCIRNRIFWAAVVAMSVYPTLTYYTLDIYRDVFMVFLWVLGLFVFKVLSQKPGFLKGLLFFIVGLLMAYVLFKFRPYLGFAYLVALVFSAFYSFCRYPFFLSLLGMVGTLFALFLGGFLEPIFMYRAIFSEGMAGGSNIGLAFSSVTGFFPDLVLSVVYQLFGLFFVNISSVIVFILESLPFIAFFYYVIKNRRFSTKFVDYLIVFFVAYTVIWLLGNDNLGTAVRLRMFSYISIFIAFCIIYQNKKIVLLN